MTYLSFLERSDLSLAVTRRLEFISSLSSDEYIQFHYEDEEKRLKSILKALGDISLDIIIKPHD